MLGQLLEPMLKRMESINTQETKNAFGSVLAELNPNWERKAVLDISDASVDIILLTPALCRIMWNLLNSNETDWAQKTAIAFSLAYFVQPNDFIPDNLPGCFGYVDDVMFLRYSMLCDLKMLPPGVADEQTEKTYSTVLSYCIPPSAKGLVDQMLNTISNRSQQLAMVPPFFLQIMCQQIIADPIGSTTPQASAPMMQQRSSGSYNPFGGSIYSEGNTTVVSFAGGGGCSCVDGNIVPW